MKRVLLTSVSVVAVIVLVGTLYRTANESIAPAISPPESASGIRFEDRREVAGISFRHTASRSPRKLMPEVMGGGVVIADFNRDTAGDLLFLNSGSLAAPSGPSTNRATHELYLGDGHGHFERAGSAWDIPCQGYGMGAAVGDYDNDGWEDVLVTSFQGDDRLFRNTGSGFVDTTGQAGLIPQPGWSTSAGFVDIDVDGDLDIYITRYVRYDLDQAKRCFSAGLHVYCTPIFFDALPDRLLLNNGDGTFSDGGERLQGDRHGKGLALAIGDLNLDGRPDVFVANDMSPNMLWMGYGQGGLRDRAMTLGVALSSVGTEEGSMGADIGDPDLDGLPDIVCTNFQYESTALYQQDTPFFFREMSDAAGIGRTARQRLSFGVQFFDADNDGDEDLYVANGHIEDNIEEYKLGVTFAQPDTLYELVDGVFIDITESAGPAVSAPRVSRGVAVGNLDRDGLLDVVVGINDGHPVVAMNRTRSAGGFMNFQLEGTSSNRSAIGAVLVAVVGERTIRREVAGADSYLSQSEKSIHLGLGDADSIDELRIIWPGGHVQEAGAPESLSPQRFYRWVEGSEPVPVEPGRNVHRPAARP
jgi:hypothetical protein